MYKHIVCMKLKDQSKAKVLKDKLDALMGAVPTLKTLEVGLDERNSDRSWHLILISTFDSEADYLAYDTHPAHVEVRNYIASNRESNCTVDYNF